MKPVLIDPRVLLPLSYVFIDFMWVAAASDSPRPWKPSWTGPRVGPRLLVCVGLAL